MSNYWNEFWRSFETGIKNYFELIETGIKNYFELWAERFPAAISLLILTNKMPKATIRTPTAD